MAQIDKFDDFESIVVDKVKNRIGYNSILDVVNNCFVAASHLVCDSHFGAIARLGHSTLGLNEHMYKSYLKATYRQRFEAHKNDPQYISNLVEEAVEETIKRNTKS